MAWCKTGETPVCEQCMYCSLALSRRYISHFLCVGSQSLYTLRLTFLRNKSEMLYTYNFISYNRIIFVSQALRWPNHPFVLKPPETHTQPMGKDCARQRINLGLEKLVLPYMFGDIPGEFNRVDVTLYTQLSADRLLNLLRISRVWAGPITAAVGGNAENMETLRNWLKDAPEELRQRKNVWIHGVDYSGVSISLNR